MQFGPVPIKDAQGTILAHNIASPDGTRLMTKGRELAVSDIELLAAHGYSDVYVAWLDPDDIDENTAALQTAQIACGEHIEMSRAAVGRVNLHAVAAGVLRVDVNGLN